MSDKKDHKKQNSLFPTPNLEKSNSQNTPSHTTPSINNNDEQDYKNTEDNPTQEDADKNKDITTSETTEEGHNIQLSDNLDEEKEHEENEEDPLNEENIQNSPNRLGGMYRNWFLDYASYVILERAVPHLADGLKPVQRRILHTMKRSDDGRYNKVAGIVGDTMHFHPHGDQSIYGALVQLGQKDLLIDTQGNWGNTLTGDGASAARYIEARLSKFALDVLFNPKTTEWKLSYDGRNKEPVALPAKFPLLLAQGSEGIAVGLSEKILPHNFGEICNAAINYLRGKAFHLYPDFATGGSIDIENYNDGRRGGSVKVRAKISKLDTKTLVITEIPYSTTTCTLIDSIIRANEKGKIRIRKVDDNTSAEAEILVHLTPGTSPDQMIDALYAFTDCEVSISPNCVVIENDKPVFLSISDVLKRNVDFTQYLLRQELEIRQSELRESRLFASLERIFIQERMYKKKNFEQASDSSSVISFLRKEFDTFTKDFYRPITDNDLLRLLEIKMARITRYNTEKADENIARYDAELERIANDLQHMVDVTVNWFRLIRDKYADLYPRHTELKSFETIVATKVAVANEKLYVNMKEGFMGTSLKKDEFVDNCSMLDDVIIFYRDGTMKVVRIADKVFIGETSISKKEKKKAEIIYIAIFKKKDKRKVYNIVYRFGKAHKYYMKRFNVPGITLDREYDITKGRPGSEVIYFSANPNGEAELIDIEFKPLTKIKLRPATKDFADVRISSRGAKGILLASVPIKRIVLKQRGASTLGGRKVWFDHDVYRINFDEHGQYLGEFHSFERIVVMLRNGDYYTTDFNPTNHYEGDIAFVRKFNSERIWTALVLDAANKNHLYVKRFKLEAPKTDRIQTIRGTHPRTKLVSLTDNPHPLFEITFGGVDSSQPPMLLDPTEFVGVKGIKAKGKRVSTLKIGKVTPIEQPTPNKHSTEEAQEFDSKNKTTTNEDSLSEINEEYATINLLAKK